MRRTLHLQGFSRKIAALAGQFHRGCGRQFASDTESMIPLWGSSRLMNESLAKGAITGGNRPRPPADIALS